jgi:WD40 repeat protein
MNQQFLALAFAAVLSAAEAAPQPGDAQPLLAPQIRVVAFSPDGNLLAAGSGLPNEPGELILWDLAARQPRWRHKETLGVPTVAFAPDGRTLAAGLYDNTVKLFDAATGQVQTTLREHTKSVRAVAFAPDGKTLATGSWDLTVKLWDVATSAVRLTLEGHTDRIYSAAFAPDGKTLLTAGFDGAKLWDTATGQLVRNWNRHGEFVVSSAAFTPDGRWMMTTGYDGTARLWDVATGELRTKLGGRGGLYRVAFAPQSGLLALCGNGKTVDLFDLPLREADGKALERIRGLIAKLDEDAYAARETATEELREIGFLAEPELRKAATESPSAEVRIRARRLRADLQRQPLAVLKGHTDNVDFVTFSPDGKLLASGSNDGTVKLWDLATRKEIATLVPRE